MSTPALLPHFMVGVCWGRAGRPLSCSVWSSPHRPHWLLVLSPPHWKSWAERSFPGGLNVSPGLLAILKLDFSVSQPLVRGSFVTTSQPTLIDTLPQWTALSLKVFSLASCEIVVHGFSFLRFLFFRKEMALPQLKRLLRKLIYGETV